MHLCSAADAANRCSWLKAPLLLFAPDEDELEVGCLLEDCPDAALLLDASPSFCPEPANLNLASVFFFSKNLLMADMALICICSRALWAIAIRTWTIAILRWFFGKLGEWLRIWQRSGGRKYSKLKIKINSTLVQKLDQSLSYLL